jgi:hypothetical protein
MSLDGWARFTGSIVHGGCRSRIPEMRWSLTPRRPRPLHVARRVPVEQLTGGRKPHAGFGDVVVPLGEETTSVELGTASGAVLADLPYATAGEVRGFAAIEVVIGWPKGQDVPGEGVGVYLEGRLVGRLDAYATGRYGRYVEKATKAGQPLQVDGIAGEADLLEPPYLLAVPLPPRQSDEPGNPKVQGWDPIRPGAEPLSRGWWLKRRRT